MVLPVLKLVQLPIPQPAKPAATANVPLAAGCLAVAAQVHGLDSRLRIDVVPPTVTDVLGDHLLADFIAHDEPRFVGFSLYLWNCERSLHLMREVKKRSPGTEIWIGGPEVGPDNSFVLEQEGFDVAVTGEAEEVFAALVERRLQGLAVDDLPGVSVRRNGDLATFTPARPAAFPLTMYPSPYLNGVLPVEAGRSTFVETVRGCKSHCTFCFYPRSSAVLRALDVAQSILLLENLRDQGAREIVFLDPTFNHRPEFLALMKAMAAVNRSGHLRFFAEVRAEGLTPEHADLLAQAGFHKLEIGLQSVNENTLAHVRRGGKPAHVAAAARMLRERGIDLLVDLIVGLPGDTADDVLRGADFLLEHGLGDSAQVFPLSVLPGTAMRAGASQDGLVFDTHPPYRVDRTASMSREEIEQTFFAVEDRLGRMLDEFPRPYLVDPLEGAEPRDVVTLDVDAPDAASVAAVQFPGAEHLSLWILGRDLWAARDTVRRAVEARLSVDPYSMLDVVLAPSQRFPIDLLDLLELELRSAVPSYASRVLRHRGVDAQRRISVVMRRGIQWPEEYLRFLRARAEVYEEMTITQAIERAGDLGESRLAARVVGPCSEEEFRMLGRNADPESVVFADRSLERRHVLDVLRYRELQG